MKLICKNINCTSEVIEHSGCTLNLINGEFISDILCEVCGEHLYPLEETKESITYSRPLWANANWSSGSNSEIKDTYTF